jgi:hypothetical protein
VPTHVREGDDGGIEFGVCGNMCTFNCAELWIQTHLGGRAGNEERWRSQDNLRLLYFMFTGRRVSRIKPAPKKTELRQYGGELDEDAFWRRMRELDPISGLRDHTFGSIVPERDRIRAALTTISVSSVPFRVISDTPGPGVASSRSVWGLCGAALATENPPDSVLLAAPIAPPAPAADPVAPPADTGMTDADLENLLSSAVVAPYADHDLILDEIYVEEFNVLMPARPTKTLDAVLNGDSTETKPVAVVEPAKPAAVKVVAAAAPATTKVVSKVGVTKSPAVATKTPTVAAKTAVVKTAAVKSKTTSKTVVTTKTTASKTAATKTTTKVTTTKVAASLSSGPIVDSAALDELLAGL